MNHKRIQLGLLTVAILLIGSVFALAQDDTSSETITLYVGPTTAECVGVAPQTCLLVKENPEDDYSFFYSNIEGFDYEEGYEYELTVEVEEVENPPADASSLKYTLVEVVSMTRALEGNLWSADSLLDIDGNTVSVFPGSKITAEFRNGQLSGNSGCNSYSGTYEIDGQNIQINQNMAVTMMACFPQEIAEQERAYLTALANAATYAVTESQMQLFDADGNVLVTYSLVVPVELTGTDWVVTGYNNGRGGFTSVLIGTEMTALFSEDGSLTGNAGCNDFTTTYSVAGERIFVEPAAVTRKACIEPEGIMEQEGEYLAALTGATNYRIQDDMLEMFDADGSRMVSYRVRTEVIGVDWQWELLRNGEEATIIPNPENYRLQLNEDGTANIQADCNSGSGTYTIEGDQISIDINAITEAACGPDSLADLYLQSLAEVSQMWAQSGNLTLSSDDSGAVMLFTS